MDWWWFGLILCSIPLSSRLRPDTAQQTINSPLGTLWSVVRPTSIELKLIVCIVLANFRIVHTWIWLGTAGIIFLMSFSRHTQNIPFNARVEFAQIDAQFHFVVVLFSLIDVLQINLMAIEKHEMRKLLRINSTDWKMIGSEQLRSYWELLFYGYCKSFQDKSKLDDYFSFLLKKKKISNNLELTSLNVRAYLFVCCRCTIHIYCLRR